LIPFELKEKLNPTDRYSCLSEEELTDFYKNRILLYGLKKLGGNIYKLHDKYVVQYNHNSNIFEFYVDTINEAIEDLLKLARFYGKKGDLTNEDFNNLEKLKEV